MAWPKILEQEMVKQGAQLDRIEAKLDALSEWTPATEPVEITAAELEEIDGVGPATAEKILELIAGK